MEPSTAQGSLVHRAGLKKVKIGENPIGEVRGGVKIISGLSLNFLSASTEKRGTTRLYMYRCNSVVLYCLYSTLLYATLSHLPYPALLYSILLNPLLPYFD